MKRIILFIVFILQLFANNKILLFKPLDKIQPSEYSVISNNSFQNIEFFLINNKYNYDFQYLDNLDKIDSLANYALIILPNYSVIKTEDYKILKKMKENRVPFILFGQIYSINKDKIENVTEDFGDFEFIDYLKTSNVYISSNTKFSRNIPTGLTDLIVIKDSIPGYRFDMPIVIAEKKLEKCILGYQDNILYSAIDFSDLPLNDLLINSYKKIIANYIDYQLNIPVISKHFIKTDKQIIFINLVVEDVNQPISEMLDILNKYPINFIAISNFRNYKPYIKSYIDFILVLFESDYKWYGNNSLIPKFYKIWDDYKKQNNFKYFIYRFYGNNLNSLQSENLEKLKIQILISDYNLSKRMIGNYKDIFYIGRLNNTVSDYFNPNLNKDTLLKIIENDISVNRYLGIPYNFYLNDQINYPSFHFNIDKLHKTIRTLSEKSEFMLYSDYYDKVKEIENCGIELTTERRNNILLIKNNSKKNLEKLYINILIPKNIKKYRFNTKDKRITILNLLDDYLITIENIQPNETIKIPYKAD